MSRLIDADEFIKWLDVGHLRSPSEVCYSEGDVKVMIDIQPTVDPVVPVRWKYYHKQNIAVCTNCSFERDLDANFGRAICCPNCGAHMVFWED